MSQTLQELMQELRDNPRIKLLVMDSRSNSLINIIRLKKIATTPNVRILVISTGTNQELPRNLFLEKSNDLLVVPATEVYQYLQSENIQQAEVIGRIQKANLIQSIRLGIMHEINQLTDVVPSSRIIGLIDDSEQSILGGRDVQFNFPVLLAPLEGQYVSKFIDYLAILEFLAKYNEHDTITRPIKKALTAALQPYKENYNSLKDYRRSCDVYDRVQRDYQRKLTRIIQYISQLDETCYFSIKDQLGQYFDKDSELG